MTDTLQAITALGAEPNTVSIGIATLIGVLVALGLVLRLKRQNIRSDVLDKAQDAYLKTLQGTVDALRARVEMLEQERHADATRFREAVESLTQERNALYKAHAEVTADVRILQSKMMTVEAENIRLRDQNDLQAEQLRFCAEEANENQAKIRALEFEVHALRQQVGEPASRSGGATAPVGEKASGTVIGTVIKVEEGKAD